MFFNLSDQVTKKICRYIFNPMTGLIQVMATPVIMIAVMDVFILVTSSHWEKTIDAWVAYQSRKVCKDRTADGAENGWSPHPKYHAMAKTMTYYKQYGMRLSDVPSVPFRELPLFELTATGTNRKQIPHCMNSETEVPDPAPEIRGAGRQ